MKNLALIFLIVIFSACGTSDNSESFDILLKGGTVFDGSGTESQKLDVGIRDNQIVYIGNNPNVSADLEFDITGLAVAPGFIDVHAHIEPITRIPDATSHLRQGVTTALGGPDGGGPWPFVEYLDSLETLPLGMNVAYLIGHNRIRRGVMGLEDRAPTQEELDKMKEHVREGMKAGAFGISTGLKYLPGAFSDVEEVIDLSKVAAEYGGIYTSHLREEGLGLIDGVQEAIQIGAEAKIPIVLTHHKAIGKPVWGKSVQTLAMLDSARALGIDVMADQYPYTASYTGLSVLIPAWAMAGGQEEFESRMSDKSLRDSIISGIEYNIMTDRGGGDLRRVQMSRTPWDSTLSGKTLHEWALRRDLQPNARTGAELVAEAQLTGGGTAIYHAINDEDVRRIMQHPFAMVASDGRLSEIGVGYPHPRAYGTFPRVLGYYSRDEGVIELKEAIRKMTSMPADRLGLADRGRIEVGKIADITVFDPLTVNDNASFTDPNHYPSGIMYVFVDGKAVIKNGEMTEVRAGQVLRGPAYSQD